MDLRTSRKLGLLCAASSISLGALALGFPAFAQDEPTTRSTSVSEVVVTAGKREQNLQEVPAAVTAFTAEMRDETGIVTAQQQLNFTPGVTYNTSADRVTIRGIGRLTSNLGTDQGVAVYNDGFYVGSVSGIGSSTLLTERVEILRGPQGTLYGRNSVGGAVNSITRRPTDDFAFDARAAVNSYGGVRGEARVAGPLLEGVDGALLFNRVYQDKGYYENTAGGPDEGGPEDSWLLDLQLKAEFNENFDAWLRYTTTDSTTRPRNSTGITQYGVPARGEGIPYVFYGLPADGNPGVDDHRKFRTDRPTIANLGDYHQVLGEAVWHAENFDLKYLGGYRTYKSLTTFDGNAVDNQDIQFPYDCLTLRGGNAAREPNLDVIEDCDLTQPGVQRQYRTVHNDTADDTTDNRTEWSHEINLTSTGDGPFQYILGAYYFKGDQDQRLNIIAIDEPGNNTIFDLAGNVSAEPNPSPNESMIYHYNSILKTTSKAVFGQVDWQFTPTLKATVGLRYTQDEKVGYEENIYVYWLVTGIPVGGYNFFTGQISDVFVPLDLVGGYCIPGPKVPGVPAFYRLNPNYACPIARDLKDSFEAVTGTAGLEWAPNDDRMVYAKYSRGFKSGGFNLGWALADPFVDSEFLDAFEVGWKEVLSDQLQFNSAVFFYKYHDQQATDSKIQNSIVLTQLINLPEVETYGLELEGIWRPLEDLRLLVNYSYLHSEIKESGLYSDSADPYAVQPGAQPVGPLLVSSSRDLQPQTLVGNTLANAPEHKVAVNGTYTWRFETGELTASATYNYISKSYQTLFNNPLHEIDGGQTTDVRVTWSDADSGWSIIGSVTNLFDEELVNGFTTLPPQNLSFQSIYLDPPRVISLEARYSF